MGHLIPFNRPSVVGRELEYVAEALAGDHASGDGPFSARCRAILERELVGSRVLLTPSCTHALELAAQLLDIAPGDEVIVPSFTFPSTANAFVLRGARIVFGDIRGDTLNLDERRLEGLLTPRTKVIAAVHYAGVGCEMDAILEIARSRGIVVVEDNAQGLFGTYRGRPLGTFGSLAAQSFHETKNVSCGEGGALAVNDESLFERAEIVREKGTDRSRFFRGQVDKYSWVDVGSSYLLADLLAAYLCGQLEAAAEIQRRRREIWERYAAGLRDWAERRGAGVPHVPPHCMQPYHMFYLLMRDKKERDALIAYLGERDINAVFHYVPLHSSRMGRRAGHAPRGCEVSENVAERLVRLPFFSGLDVEDQSAVIETVRAFDH